MLQLLRGGAYFIYCRDSVSVAHREYWLLVCSWGLSETGYLLIFNVVTINQQFHDPYEYKIHSLGIPTLFSQSAACPQPQLQKRARALTHVRSFR